MVAQNFSGKHGASINHNTGAKLIYKFKKTGNVADQSRSGPRRRAADEDTSAINICIQNSGIHIEQLIYI